MKKFKYKTTVRKIDNSYTLITIVRPNIVEYYLEKLGYGHLFYVVGTQNEIRLADEYIQHCINIAEETKFWGED